MGKVKLQLLQCTLFLCFAIVFSNASKFAGRYDCVKIEFTEPCPHSKGKNFPLHFDMSVKKFEDGRFLIGNWTVGVPLDENISHNFTVYQWGRSGYNLVMTHVGKKTFISAKKRLPDLYKYGSTAVGHELLGLQVGNYTFEKSPLCLHYKEFPILPYGKHKYMARFYMDEEEVGCCVLYVDVIP